MPDLLKHVKKIIEDNPELKSSVEEDERYRKDRITYYLSKGLEHEEANLRAWDDYWVMANERDGVEFSIHRLDDSK